jgi:hypothetical protein
VFLGRVVEAGEPEWLPEDRDIIETFQEFQKTRHHCGRWEWEYEDLEGLELGHSYCPFCADIGPYQERLEKDKQSRGQSTHGLTYGWYPPRSEDEEDD